MRALVLAAAAALLISGPAGAAAKAAAAPGAPKAQSKMGDCAHKWSAMSPGDKGKYNDKAKGMKSKKGNSLSGYNVWTGECMKAKA